MHVCTEACLYVNARVLSFVCVCVRACVQRALSVVSSDVHLLVNYCLLLFATTTTTSYHTMILIMMVMLIT